MENLIFEPWKESNLAKIDQIEKVIITKDSIHAVPKDGKYIGYWQEFNRNIAYCRSAIWYYRSKGVEIVNLGVYGEMPKYRIVDYQHTPRDLIKPSLAFVLSELNIAKVHEIEILSDKKLRIVYDDRFYEKQEIIADMTIASGIFCEVEEINVPEDLLPMPYVTLIHPITGTEHKVPLNWDEYCEYWHDVPENEQDEWCEDWHGHEVSDFEYKHNLERKTREEIIRKLFGIQIFTDNLEKAWTEFQIEKYLDENETITQLPAKVKTYRGEGWIVSHPQCGGTNIIYSMHYQHHYMEPDYWLETAWGNCWVSGMNYNEE